MSKRILKGAKPCDLPLEAPDRYNTFVIDLKAARGRSVGARPIVRRDDPPLSVIG